MNPSLPLRHAGAALTGPVIWAAHFLTVYASESLICRLSAPLAHDVTVAGATLAAVLAILWQRSRFAARLRPIEAPAGTARFLRRTGLALDGLSLLGIGWVAFAALLLAACR